MNIQMNDSFAVVVMGVSGCGKSTIGSMLAHRLGAGFLEGDSLHAPESVARMARGEPLMDADRWPWLDRIAARVRADLRQEAQIVSCSALRRIYRDRLRQGIGPALRFIYLESSEAMISTRLAARRGHFMPHTLLASQFATLEAPKGEPDVIAIDASRATARIVSEAAAALEGR